MTLGADVIREEPLALKSDPYARWLAERTRRQPLRKPLSIYEVHLGSWRRVPEQGDRFP